jgi:glutamate/tyrosine decarboxylase-like PLP-dependent enzyme
VHDRRLLEAAAAHAAAFLESLPDAPVRAEVADPDELHATVGGPLPDHGTDPRRVLDELVAAASRGVVRSQSPRYFGFVVGGTLPAALAADWMTSTWDQNSAGYVLSPVSSVLQEVTGAWLKELLGLPADASYGTVTGCQMAHVTCLAAARHAVLARRGWDAERQGLHGAPRVRMLVGEQRHVTVDRAARLLGLGSEAIVPVASDLAGRMDAAALRAALATADGPAIVVAQAGEVHTGVFDPFDAIVDAARDAGAWVHVDGAFGLWAAASPRFRHLTNGTARADSWATDGHKWLNVPYDCGLAFVAHPEAHHAAMTSAAAYVRPPVAGERDEAYWTPEYSRRSRAIALYAALRSLGRSGIAQLVERCCDCARRFADELRAEPGVEVVNDVVLNQVLVRFGDDDAITDAVILAVQEDGTCWVGGSSWQGRRVMRISVSNWATTVADVDRSVGAIRDAMRAVPLPAARL